MDIERIFAAAGGVKALGVKLGIAHTSVIGWRQSGRVPAERCQAISAVTGIPLHVLRPDIYPDPNVTPSPNPEAQQPRQAGVDPRVANEMA